MKNNKTIFYMCLLIFVLIFAAWIANYMFAINAKGSPGSGTFGDAFGAVNSLFTGFAFLGLMIAIILQRTELSIIREERDDTRALLGEQRALNEAHERTLRKQSFDQNFMGVMTMIIELRQSILIKSSTNKTTMSIAASFTGEKLKKIPIIWGSIHGEQNDYQKECYPIVRLTSVAESMVYSSDVIDRMEKADYLNRVAALFDENLSTIFSYYAVIYAIKRPEYLRAYNSLKLGENIDSDIAAIIRDYQITTN